MDPITRGVSLGFDFGKNSSEFRYRIDDGMWTDVVRDRPQWCGDMGWFRLYHVSDELMQEKHSFELEVTHGDRTECTGSNFNLALIGVIE